LCGRPWPRPDAVAPGGWLLGRWVGATARLCASQSSGQAAPADGEEGTAMNGTLHPTARESRSRGVSTEAAMLERWEPLARHLAYRYAGAAEREDLEQVARLALLQAARRFDPSRGDQFSTFAASVILGHLRHYLRDQEPMIRIPRRCWELYLPVKRLWERLAQALGRAPTVAELAARLGASEEDVATALKANEFFRLVPLDKPWGPREERGQERSDDAGESLAGRLGRVDPRLEAVEQHVAFQQVMERLPARLREILQRRYFQGLSQKEVARDLGLSQMHISRLERRALAQLREELRGDGEPEPEASAEVPAATVPLLAEEGCEVALVPV
jgi:RNA polymerase sigma-B factor